MNSKKLVLIPLMMVVYFFIHFASDLFYFIELGKSLTQFLFYLVATTLVYFAGFDLVTRKKAYTLLFSTLLFLFLFYGSLTDLAENSGLISNYSATSLWSVIIVAGLGLLIGFIILKIGDKLVMSLLKFWLIYLTILILYDSMLFVFTKKGETQYLNQDPAKLPPIVGDKPSVFFLLFDMYPSNKVLKNYLHYDNDSIHRYLTKKNFFVTKNSHSLYKETYYSIGSTFSLAPLTYLNDNSIKNYKKKLIALKNINKSSLLDIFKKSGYVINNNSVFNLENKESPLQFNLNYHLENALTGSTLFNRFIIGIEPDFIAANRNIDITFLKKSWSGKLKEDIAFLNQKFNKLTDNFQQTTPTFNYFHFMIPHPPTIYDGGGNENNIKDLYNTSGYANSIENFVAYTAYGNQLMEKMVEKILRITKGKVVIIIQGDHGYREFTSSFPEEVRLGVFNAVYLPDKNYRNLHDSQSTLQTVRQLLTNQFYSKELN